MGFKRNDDRSQEMSVQLCKDSGWDAVLTQQQGEAGPWGELLVDGAILRKCKVRNPRHDRLLYCVLAQDAT